MLRQARFRCWHKDNNLSPERGGCRLCGSHFEITVWIVWIHEKSDDGARRYKGMQQLQSLGHCCRTKYSHTSRIAARPAEAIYQTFLDRITKHS
jgi:hypothetical protein